MPAKPFEALRKSLIAAVFLMAGLLAVSQVQAAGPFGPLAADHPALAHDHQIAHQTAGQPALRPSKAAEQPDLNRLHRDLVHSTVPARTAVAPDSVWARIPLGPTAGLLLLLAAVGAMKAGGSGKAAQSNTAGKGAA